MRRRMKSEKRSVRHMEQDGMGCRAAKFVFDHTIGLKINRWTLIRKAY